MNNLEIENHSYWIKRAKGYSEVNKEEMAGVQNKKWTSFLTEEISKHFPDKKYENIKILDVGAGPGFVSIILAKAGFNVTAFDFAETMLTEAKINAGTYVDRICFIQGDAMDLPFDNNTFDVVFSRNLMWNIPFPEKAYSQWIRILKKNGLMLVFDANWYTYLVDENKKSEYELDRANVAAEGLGDYNIGENFDKMEVIADLMPATRRNRPEWDVKYLESLNIGRVSSVWDIGQKLYSEKEKINYKSTPLFMVRFVKE